MAAPDQTIRGRHKLSAKPFGFADRGVCLQSAVKPYQVFSSAAAAEPASVVS